MMRYGENASEAIQSLQPKGAAWQTVTQYPEKLADISGFICGFICGGVQNEGQSWVEILEGHLKIADRDILLSRASLVELYKNFTERLQTGKSGLAQFLDNPDLTLIACAYALKRWCAGFLQGISLAGMKTLFAQTNFETFAEIAALDLNKIEIREEDKGMFVSVIKYLDDAINEIYHLANVSSRKLN